MVNFLLDHLASFVPLESIPCVAIQDPKAYVVTFSPSPFYSAPATKSKLF